LRNVDEIRKDLRDVRIFYSRYLPFIVIPLSYLRIVATHAVPTAGVDIRGVLAINPEYWAGLSMENKRYVAIHESLHVVLCHPFRRKGFNREAYNVAADGKVNSAIGDARVSGVNFDYNSPVSLNSLATVTGLRVEDLQKMSTEEIARILENHDENAKESEGAEGGLEGDLLIGEVDGEIVQEGDENLGAAKTGEDLKEAWRRLCEKASAFAKQAGNMPAALERIVDEVLEVKPPWQVTLRFGLRNGAKVDSSFAYTNRRSDDLPGPLGYRYTVWCLIDCSGSIGEEELKTFLGVAKHEARNFSLRVIAWDTEAYELLKAERPADVSRRVAPKMKGGGGTVCLPVLKRVYRLMSQGDVVIVLTDGDIFDADKSETQEWFRRVSAKAGFALIGYTVRPVTAPGFATSHINLNFLGNN
jgi:predicted metal-dependent peptidase